MYLKYETDKFLIKSNFTGALNLIDEKLSEVDISQERKFTLYYLKAWIFLIELFDADKALEVIKKGLLENGQDYNLLRLKARIFAFDSKYKD